MKWINISYSSSCSRIILLQNCCSRNCGSVAVQGSVLLTDLHRAFHSKAHSYNMWYSSDVFSIILHAVYPPNDFYISGLHFLLAWIRSLQKGEGLCDTYCNHLKYEKALYKSIYSLRDQVYNKILLLHIVYVLVHIFFWIKCFFAL